MAELTKPAYSPNLRLNIPSARVSGSVPTSSPSGSTIIPGQEQRHNAEMAKIAINSISQIENAYDTAEMQRVRHEMDEETVRLNKHIKDQEAVVADNLSTMNATFLDPRGVEDNFNADGITVGGNKLTPYEVSDDLSDKAKELIQPAIDLANNNFSRDTQTKFSGELTKRSNARIKVNYKKRLSNFQDVLNDNTRDKTKDNSHVFKPDGFQPAIDAVNAWEKELREEMKYKSVNEETLELHLHQMKEDLAGIILNKHLTHNPKEAYNQYLENKHSVMGVPVDSERIGKFLDAHIKTEHDEAEREKEDAFMTFWGSRAYQQPDLTLNQLAKSSPENIQILQDSMNGQLRDIPDELRNYVPNYDLIKDNPMWTKSRLEKVVLAAVKGQDRLLADTEQRQGGLFSEKLKADLGSTDIHYSRGIREKLYSYDKTKKAWIPKIEAINNFANDYGLKRISIETAMIAIIAGSGLREEIPGAGVGNGDFNAFQNKVLRWHQDHIMIDRGVGDSFDATNPLKQSKGIQKYNSFNEDQQKAIKIMVTDLKDLKNLAVTHKDLPIKALEKEFQSFNERFQGEGGTVKLQASVWSIMKQNFYTQRMRNLRESPIGTVLRDLDYYSYSVKKNNGLIPADEMDPQHDKDVRYSAYKRMVQLGVWPKEGKWETFLGIPEPQWIQDLEYLGATKDSLDQIEVLENKPEAD